MRNSFVESEKYRGRGREPICAGRRSASRKKSDICESKEKNNKRAR
jgi:hypothetical protein